MKVTRLAAASLAVLACATIAAPAHAAQPHATDKQNAVAVIMTKSLQQTKASDPKAFQDFCTLYVINAKKVLNMFVTGKRANDLRASLGASKMDFLAGTNIAVKKICS